ncbi:MAG: hypothetical protein ISR98_02160 [Parcubacteria group bacterium]|nr:hypothetical protein [Parcubacteria group bacterium]
MKTINYGKASFTLTEEEFKKFIKATENSKRVYIPRLEVFLSDMFIWAGEKPDDNNRKLLHDGSYAIKRFGEWYSEKMPDAKIQLKYYPELLKDEDVETKRLS